MEPIVSSSLLPNQWEMNDVREFYDPRFDFMQDPEWLPRAPVAKQKKLSLSLNKEYRKERRDSEHILHDNTNIIYQDTSAVLPSDRFGFPTSEELCVAAKGVVPNNTLCNTRWVEKYFQTWAAEHKRVCPEAIGFTPES